MFCLKILTALLKLMSLQDLLNACSSNLQINRICQGRTLWNFKLVDDFDVQNLSTISNLREYYIHLFQERIRILNFILNNITVDFFNTHADGFFVLHIDDYEEFVKSQNEVIGSLSEKEILAITGFMDIIFPRSFILYLGGNNMYGISTFFFDITPRGYDIVYIM